MAGYESVAHTASASQNEQSGGRELQAQNSGDNQHLPRMTEFLRNDILASVVVFLVAVPLCLGIALASGAPLFSGIVAGIVGGIVVGYASGSHVSVSGPAAGLTVVCATAIKDIGSFEGFLTAVVLAGMIQLLFGYFRLGLLGEYVPNAVIKGMMAGIGAVIILKQIPHALGEDSNFEGDLEFWQLGNGENSLSAILNSVANFHPTATMISIGSILLLCAWELGAKKKITLFKVVPGSLVVVVLGVIFDNFMAKLGPAYDLRGPASAKVMARIHHVSLPEFDSFSQIGSVLKFPDLGVLSNPAVLMAAITIAIIASIESLLSIEASDKLDPYKRISSTNRELKAQGLGNICSGLLGGLPITAVIVRSSTNIYGGAKTKASAIFHGILLLFCALLIPHILNLIPLSCLAAVLIMVGYKLVSPKLVKATYKAGPDQFIPFVVTLTAILFTDLLTGVLLGMVAGYLFVLKTNHHDAISLANDHKDYLMRFNKDVSFVNKSEVKRTLRTIPDGATLLIDGTKAMFIDQDIYDLLDDFQEQAQHRGINVEMKNVKKKTLCYLSQKSL